MENIDLTLYENSGFSTVFTVTDSNNNAIPLTGYDLDLTFYDTMGTTILATYSEADTSKLFLTGVVGEVQIMLDLADIALIGDGTHQLIINDGTLPVLIVTGNVFKLKQDKSNLGFLIPFVRLKIGDINPASYKYMDEWILKALTLGVKNLQRYWNYKYLIDEDGIVSRNPYSIQFVIENPPLIQAADEYVIVLMASIIILEGSLEMSAWDTSSWADAEIRYTNIDGSRIRESHLRRLLDELNSLITPPSRRLARTRRESLPGYLNNPQEHKSEY